MITDEIYYRLIEIHPGANYLREGFAEYLEAVGDIRARGYRFMANYGLRPTNERPRRLGNRIWGWWWNKLGGRTTPEACLSEACSDEGMRDVSTGLTRMSPDKHLWVWETIREAEEALCAAISGET